MDLRKNVFEFHYASISMKPYSGNNQSATQLLKSIVGIINDPNSKDRIIDRYARRAGPSSRELVILPLKYTRMGQRCVGRIILLRKKIPLTWKGKDTIEYIEKPENSSFIELTNFVIDFGVSEPTIMVEFNSEGPRMSDVEYYLKQFSINNQIAKSLQFKIHLKTDYRKLDQNIRNVLSVIVKVKGAYTNRASWLTDLRKLSETTCYEDVRLELFFKRKKDSAGRYLKNIRGLEYARNIIQWINGDKTNIHYLGDLKMSYQVNDEEIIDLDFLKNKCISLIDGHPEGTIQFTDAMLMEYTNYLSTGRTNQD